jgi:hypothetical protein
VSANTFKGNGAEQSRSRLDKILLTSLQELAAAGRVETACRLAGQACAALRQSDPAAWRGFNALLHRLAKHVS